MRCESRRTTMPAPGSMPADGRPNYRHSQRSSPPAKAPSSTHQPPSARPCDKPDATETPDASSPPQPAPRAPRSDQARTSDQQSDASLLSTAVSAKPMIPCTNRHDPRSIVSRGEDKTLTLEERSRLQHTPVF